MGASTYRNTSFASSTSSSRPSRTPSVASRNTSFSSSVGPGARPPSAYGSRPQTSHSFGQPATSRQLSTTKGRPASSMDTHSEEAGLRKGTMPLCSPCSSSAELSVRKVRGAQLHTLKPQPPMGNKREVSISTSLSNSFSKLKLDDAGPLKPKRETQTNCRPTKIPSTPLLSTKSFKKNGPRNLGNGTETSLVLFRPPGGSLVAPKTPSQIPVLSKSEIKSDAVILAPATPCKTPKPSPPKSLFLSKDSNTKSFIAWDLDSRLGTMDATLADLQQKMNSDTMERSGLEEAVGIYKLKSRFPSIDIRAKV